MKMNPVRFYRLFLPVLFLCLLLCACSRENQLSSENIHDPESVTGSMDISTADDLPTVSPDSAASQTIQTTSPETTSSQNDPESVTPYKLNIIPVILNPSLPEEPEDDQGTEISEEEYRTKPAYGEIRPALFYNDGTFMVNSRKLSFHCGGSSSAFPQNGSVDPDVQIRMLLCSDLGSPAF